MKLSLLARIKKSAFFLAVVIGIIIFYVSSLSFPPNPIKQFSWSTIAYHFGIFFLFSFFIFLSLGAYFFLIALFSASYAGLDELHQFFIPNRACTFSDFLVDLAGILAGLIFALFIAKLLNKT